MKIHLLIFFIGVSILALFRKRDNFRGRGRGIGGGGGLADSNDSPNDHGYTLFGIILMVFFYLLFIYFASYLEARL
jgi:hypothetical protein